jgi:menaquinone-dependent protoporphyrinogen oxidase
MAKKCLVVYASKAGSTREVAEKVGQVLSDKGLSVDVRSVKQVHNLKGYDAVVLGTAVRMFKPLGMMMTFVNLHKRALSQVPTAAFTVGLAMKDAATKGTADAEKYATPFMSQLENNKSKTYFAGKLDLDTLDPIFRAIMANMTANDPGSLGDFRDWNAIQTWAATLPASLGLGE